jgi:hypothetical protein
MSAALLKVVVALAPALVLLTGSALLLLRTRAVSSWLQLFGTIGLTVVVLTHVCEMFQLLPWMPPTASGITSIWQAPSLASHCFRFRLDICGTNSRAANRIGLHTPYPRSFQTLA